MGWSGGGSGGGGGTGNVATVNGDAGPAVILTLDGIATAEATAADVSLNSHKLTNVTDPASAQDAATKAYVDAVAQGLIVKPSVVCATTANISLTGEQTIDGVTTSASRVLVKDQSTASQNGIYLSASGAWSRVADMNAGSEIPGAFVFVESGTANAGAGYVVAGAGPFTLGTTAINWTQFSGAGEITAGNGISKSGNSLSINTAVTVDKTTAQTLTNKTLTAPAITSPTGITPTDVGLGNVTNDAQLKASALDTDGTLAANSDTRVASQKATKTYVGTETTRATAAEATNAAAITAETTRATAAEATKMLALTRTSVKTSGYTAVSGDYVPVDTTSGGVTITLPAAATGAIVAIKHVIQGGTNSVTFACAGADVFNKSGGATTGTLTLLNQGVVLIGASGIWSVIADDLPLSQLDARYLTSAAIGVTVQAFDSGLDVLRVQAAGANVPRRALELFRSGYGPKRTRLAANISDTTSTLIQVDNPNIARGNGINEIVRIDNEQLLVCGVYSVASGPQYLMVKRAQNGTTAATHTAGAAVLRKSWSDVVCVGDSTVQGTTSSLVAPASWDCWVDRLKRGLAGTFGGLLGDGFYPIWRGPAFANTGQEWTLSGAGWATGDSTTTWAFGPFAYTPFNSGSDKIATWTRPAGLRVQEIHYYFADQAGADWSGSYSIDGGTTWVDVTATQPTPARLRKITISCDDPTDFRVRCATASGTSKTHVPVGIAVYNQALEWGTTEGIVVHNLGFDGNALSNFVGGVTMPTAAALTGVSVDVTTDTFTKTAHGLSNGDQVYVSGLSPAAGIAENTLVFVINSAANTFKLSLTNGGSAIDITGSNNTLINVVKPILLTTSSGSAAVVASSAIFASSHVGRTIIGTGIPAGSYVSAYTDSTHVTISANATATATGVFSIIGHNGAPGTGAPSTGQFSRVVSDAKINDGTNSTALNSLYSPTAAFSASDVGKAVVGSGIADGTYISAFVSSTKVTLNVNGTTVASGGKVAIVGATGWNRLIEGDGSGIVPDLIISGFWTNDMSQQASGLGGCETNVNLNMSRNLGFALDRWTSFANVLGMVAFEQGGTRLDGEQTTAAAQLSYRTAMHNAYNTFRNLGGLFGASGYAAADINYYAAWAAEGNTGYTAAAADGLIDTADTSGFHPGPTGAREIAARALRELLGGL